MAQRVAYNTSPNTKCVVLKCCCGHPDCKPTTLEKLGITIERKEVNNIMDIKSHFFVPEVKDVKKVAKGLWTKFDKFLDKAAEKVADKIVEHANKSKKEVK